MVLTPDLVGQYTSYFANIFAPIIFVIGFWSLLLSAMQTGLTALDMDDAPSPMWKKFQRVSFWFCVITILGFCTVGFALICLLFALLLNELRFALLSLWQRKQRNQGEIRSRSIRGQ